MERAAQGNFAYISWKTYQQDIIARNFVDSQGRRRVYQVSLRVWLDDNTVDSNTASFGRQRLYSTLRHFSPGLFHLGVI